jgi:hypothetical protein
MKTGDRVTISGAAGIVTGEILDLRSVDDLPDIAGTGDLGWITREALRADGDKRLALISHQYAEWTVYFIAIETREGKWFDLHGEELTITPASGPPTRIV